MNLQNILVFRAFGTHAVPPRRGVCGPYQRHWILVAEIINLASFNYGFLFCFNLLKFFKLEINLSVEFDTVAPSYLFFGQSLPKG